jgi:protein-tyrosine phosphatase
MNQLTPKEIQEIAEEAVSKNTNDSSEKPGSSIPIASLPNLRDLGGWATRDGGTVRRGQVFRSTALHALTGEDVALFGNLGIRTVYDLRTEAEKLEQPDRVPDGVEYGEIDVMADSSGAAPTQTMKVLGNPQAAEELLGGGRAEQGFIESYREFVTLPSARSGYRRLFTELADPQHRPGLFHCTTGKDRTGWAAAALLLLVGVSEDDVMDDYLLTNAQLLPHLQPVLDQFAAAGGDPDVLLPVLGVEAEYLEASLGEMRAQYGTIKQYFTDGLQIDAPTQSALRAALRE